MAPLEPVSPASPNRRGNKPEVVYTNSPDEPKADIRHELVPGILHASQVFKLPETLQNVREASQTAHRRNSTLVGFKDAIRAEDVSRGDDSIRGDASIRTADTGSSGESRSMMESAMSESATVQPVILEIATPPLVESNPAAKGSYRIRPVDRSVSPILEELHVVVPAERHLSPPNQLTVALSAGEAHEIPTDMPLSVQSKVDMKSSVAGNTITQSVTADVPPTIPIQPTVDVPPKTTVVGPILPKTAAVRPKTAPATAPATAPVTAPVKLILPAVAADSDSDSSSSEDENGSLLPASSGWRSYFPCFCGRFF